MNNRENKIAITIYAYFELFQIYVMGERGRTFLGGIYKS